MRWWSESPLAVSQVAPCRSSSHLWRLELPADLAVGQHTAEVTATDVQGRTFTETLTFEVTE